MIGKEVEPTTRNKGAAWEATQDSFREYSFPLFFFFLFPYIEDNAGIKCGGVHPAFNSCSFLKKKNTKKRNIFLFL